MNNYDSSITGIVIDQYPSVAEVVKIIVADSFSCLCIDQLKCLRIAHFVV